jgi:hypothetical protein
MATKNDIFLGTELKLNIHIEPIGDVSMDDYDFEVELYCSSRKTLRITKSQARRIDKDNYVILADTNELGTGEVKIKVTAQIPDADFDDLLRTEVQVIDTGVNVVKTL